MPKGEPATCNLQTVAYNLPLHPRSRHKMLSCHHTKPILNVICANGAKLRLTIPLKYEEYTHPNVEIHSTIPNILNAIRL